MESNDQNQATIETTGLELGFWDRLINIFTNPRKTFESLDRQPSWLVPVIIMVCITILSTQLLFPMLIDKQLEMIRNNPNISTEQLQAIEQQLTENVNTQRVITLISQIIFIPVVFYFLLVFIFYFIGTVILGGDASYKKVLSVFAWSTFILALSVIITFPLAMIKNSMSISLSPALLLPDDSIDTTIYAFLANFNIFTIWFLAVFATGFAVIYRFSLTKAYITIGLLWCIWIAISTAFSGFFSRFGM
ncbi:MAG: hypothetical protein DRP26_01685 [Candidatus Zixiibacteriota bacterium]|nr:MAG: hypothetical protein DRP26_01685 [candidate division Zixibacteria bacterium]